MSNESPAKDRIVLCKMIERIQRTISYCNGHAYEEFEANTML